MFMNIDYVRVRINEWFNTHTDNSSDYSFSDCECSKCKRKLQHSNEMISPKIPSISSVEETIQQVDDGILKEIARIYHRTEHWRILRTIYSQRQTLYREYQ